MSVAPAGAAPSLAAAAFPSELSLGQIVKARVLRHYEGGRYLVSLEGRERLVDSSVPLTTGELIRGRVVAVGDRVELQPVPEEAPPAADAAGAEAPAPADELAARFARFGLPLDQATRDALARSLRGARDPDTTILAAMTLAKIGLPHAPALLEAVQALLRRRPSTSNVGEAPREAFSAAPGAPLAPQLHEALRTALSADDNRSSAAPAPTAAALSGDGADQRPAADHGGAGHGSGQQLGQWVLNTPTGGAVAHRVGTLPLLLGGRLVEVDVALFEQDARRSREGGTRQRHLVFMLDAGALGPVEVSARLVDARLRIRFAAEREATVERLAGAREELGRRLAELGWTVDEIVYESRAAAAQNAAYLAVADHVVTQGSLDRKI